MQSKGLALSFDSGFNQLQRLIDCEADGDEGQLLRNEAQTRFDVIDETLKNILDWPTTKIHVEKHVDDSGYTDYELVDVGTLAIVEAKREGVAFQLPLDLTDGICNIPALLSDRRNGGLKSALQQVMRYASPRGVALCVATNGHQWIAFLGSRSDGIPPLDGKALVIHSLKSMKENFVLFYNCLSYEGIIRKRIFPELNLGNLAPPASLSASIHGYPGTKRRNRVQSTLQYLGELVLEDMPQEERYSDLFLKECYASSGALSSYAEISRELLTSRNASLLADLGAIEEPAVARRGVNPDLALNSASVSDRPVVLLGGVGVGKSTFIQHLVKVDAKSEFEDAIAITVDYGRGATFSTPAQFAIDQIHRALLENHNIDVEDSAFVLDIYRKDLGRFDSSVQGQLKDVAPETYAVKRIEFLDSLVKNRSEHLRKSVARISKTRRRHVVIFLDNVDQRDLDDQSKVFLTANELAATWEATVYVTLRPETYYESQRYGAVSGYHPRVFSIAPPRTDVMLQKRVDFALLVLENGDARTTSSGVGFESQSLLLFLRVLEQNFSRNRLLLALIDNLAGGNMRRALDFVTQFIGSGHVDTEKIIAVEQRDPGRYNIPLHEFLRSLIHGDGQYYDPQTSPIANLFALDRPEARNHFLMPLFLDYVLSKGDTKDSAGYVELSDVYRHLQGLGFALDAATYALSYCGRFRLIEAPLADFDAAQVDRVRITTVGAYTLKNLPQLFTYCDAMIVDTPILDKVVRDKIIIPNTMADRLLRVELFSEYLDLCWAGSGLEETGWSWRLVSTVLRSDCAGVAGRTGVRT